MNTIRNENYTEQVQCPYCHKVIKAPNRANTTFLCPNCGKELITYDKNKETEEIPLVIDKWNWGAFFFSWLWGLVHGIYWPFITIIGLDLFLVITGFSPVVNSLWGILYVGISIALGMSGNKWAWKTRNWTCTTDFLKMQHQWAMAALWTLTIGGILFLFIWIVLSHAIINAIVNI